MVVNNYKEGTTSPYSKQQTKSVQRKEKSITCPCAILLLLDGSNNLDTYDLDFSSSFSQDCQAFLFHIDKNLNYVLFFRNLENVF